MALILPGNVASALPTGYDVANSCRFNDGDSPQAKKDTTSSDNIVDATISMWVKRGTLGTAQVLLAGNYKSNDLYYCSLSFTSGDALSFKNSDNGTNCELITTRLFRDCSAWYYICVECDLSDAEADRVKIYINGTTRVTDFSTSTNMTGDQFLLGKSGYEVGVGALQSASYFDGYMAEVCYVDGVSAGSPLTPTSFGEYNSDSPTIWQPIEVSELTFGANGFYLDFEASGNLGNDANGGTDLTETNLAATDQVTDSPTNNWCVMNPLSTAVSYKPTISQGNLQSVSPVYGAGLAISTLGATSGKWYAEMYNVAYASLDRGSVGITGDPIGTVQVNPADHNIGTLTTSLDVGYLSDGQKKVGNSYSSYGDTFAVDDIISIALNVDDDEVIFYKNGTAQASGSAISFTSGGTYHFVTSSSSNGGGNTWVINFGQEGSFAGNATAGGNADGNGYGDFFYSVPANHYCLNTKNLAEFG